MSPESGLHLLYEPLSNEETAVDIVFVHGLGGGYLSTWGKDNVCWPRDILKEDLPIARVLSNEYDTKIFKLAELANRTNIAGHAENLLKDLARARRNLTKLRPIIFICHSLGGLVVKQALIRSSEYYHNQQQYHEDLGSIFPSTLGVVFLGTPHRGSAKASIRKLAANAGKILGATDKILRALENDSDLLEQQRHSFDSIRKNLLVVCLWEESPMRILGMIVPEASAVVDGPDILSANIPKSDHGSMTKFSARSQKGYEIVLDYVQRCLGTKKNKFRESSPRNGEEISGLKLSVIAASQDHVVDTEVSEITDQCILESLRFPHINNRRMNISRAHCNIMNSDKSTFDWIFDRDASKFLKWLESDDGIFWVNGKAGSGKSTLMKFITESPRLYKILQADTSRLFCLASFFFRAAGTSEQKSQLGLLRTILFQILSQHQAYIRELFEDAWNALYEVAEELLKGEKEKQKAARRDPDSQLMNPQIMRRRILMNLAAFADLQWSRVALLNYATKLFSGDVGFKMFLIIDGLDEYEGSEDELQELISYFLKGAKISSIKICVSSRPWAIFETNFGGRGVPSLRLQDLTSGDIATYVADSFDSSPLMKILKQANPYHMPDFCSGIVSKAEGVFLWVRLVVKSLIAGLQNGDELSVLQERVDELPADLELLYQHMLQRIPERYWGASSRLFRLMEAAEDIPPSLLLWHAGERGQNPVESDLSDETKLARCYQVYLRLLSQCASLLEDAQPSPNSPRQLRMTLT